MCTYMYMCVSVCVHALCSNFLFFNTLYVLYFTNSTAFLSPGLYDDESKSSVPASPNSNYAKNILNHLNDFK